MDVAVVQPNIHLSQKWKPGGARANIESLLTLSQPAITQETDVVIWPESATSSYILQGNQNYLQLIPITRNSNFSNVKGKVSSKK